MMATTTLWPPGHRPPLDDAIKVGVRCARPFTGARPDLADDLVQAARIAAWQVWRDFDPAKNTLFGPLLKTRVRGACIDELRVHAGHGFRGGPRAARLGEAPPAPLSLSTPVRLPRGDERTLADFVTDDADPADEAEQYHDRLRLVRRCLPPRHRLVMHLIYGHAATATHKATAQALGLSESYICQFHAQAAAMVRDRYPEGLPT